MVSSWTIWLRQWENDNTIRLDEVTPEQADQLMREGWTAYGRGTARTLYRPGTYPGYSDANGNGSSPSQGEPPAGGPALENNEPAFDNDAYEFMRRQFSQWGIDGLDSAIRNYLEEGYGPDTIALLLQDTQQYKQRFAANERRRVQGLKVLSPAEYLATERAYREVLSAAGLPTGFYDSPQDFQKWIEGDVSPTEIKERVDAAVALVNNVDPDIRRYFEQHYTTGDMIAYALDRKRATAVLNRQVAAAGIGGAAASQGVSVGTGLAERLAQTGLDSEQARSGFGVVADQRDLAEKIGALYGESYGEGDLIDEVFFSDADAQRKRQRLSSRERATFGGRSAVGQGSLSRDTTGQF